MDSTVFYGINQAQAVDVVTGAASPSGLFKFYTTTAIAAAESSTSSVPVLYNPAASGVVARVQAVRFGAVAGTVIAGCLLYGVQESPGLSVLTEGPDPINCFIGRGQECVLKWYTVATIAAAPTIIFPNGISAGGAYAAGPLFTMYDPVGGSIVLPPDTAFWPYLAKNAVAMTALITVDVVQSPMLDSF